MMIIIILFMDVFVPISQGKVVIYGQITIFLWKWESQLRTPSTIFSFPLYDLIGVV